MSGHFLFQLKSKLYAKMQCSLSMVYLTHKLNIPTGHVDIKLTTEKSMFKKRERNKRAMIYLNSTNIYDTHENDFAIFDVGRENYSLTIIVLKFLTS